MPRLKSTLVDDIFNDILHKINRYVYVAGDVISEANIANEMNVSRTPVREAILKLIDVGLLTRNKSKIIVKPLNYHDINEILDTRLALEIMSARTIHARGGITEEELGYLYELHNNMKIAFAQSQPENSFENDAIFHFTIIKYSGNSRLIDFSHRLILQSERFRQVTTLTPARYAITINEHSQILTAFKENNLNDMIDSLLIHTSNSKENYASILNNDMWLRMMKTLKV